MRRFTRCYDARSIASVACPVTPHPRRLPPRRALDAGGPDKGRAQPRGEGPRPQRPAAMPWVRTEGSSGGLDQVAGTGAVKASGFSGLVKL
jgi:hypothetical protein